MSNDRGAVRSVSNSLAASSLDLQNAAAMLLATAERLPARSAIIEPSGTTSFAELRDSALAIAASLRRAGVQPDDRVAIFLERGAASAAAYFGTLAAGGVAIILNEGLRRRQIAHILRDSGARVAISRSRLLPALEEAAPADLESLLMDANDGQPGDAPAAGGAELAPRTGADMAHIIYTSGSTGMPKGVVVSHANVWAGTRAVVSYVGVGPDDRIAALLPMGFDYGLNQLHCAAATGAALVVERSPIPHRVVEALFEREVTVLPAVPPLWLQLLEVERFRDERLPRLRAMTNTGGRLPTAAVRALRARQPGADLFLMYGLTEAFRSTYLSPDKVDHKPHSIGRAIPGAEILVVRDDLTACAPGEVGQLVHRGPTVTLGYWNHPDATRARFGPHPLRPAGAPDAERVVFSGDFVRMDEEGDLYFVGRRDAMIKSMGHRVGPDEVIDALYASGELVEAALTTEPDDARGDAIVAHVVLAPAGDLDRLKRFAARELPRYMQPARYAVHEALARTATGKHDASALSEPDAPPR